MLEGISNSTLFSNTNSSEYKAFDWLVYKDDRRVCPFDETLVQRYVLAVLYYTTNGDDWWNCTQNEATDCGEFPFLSPASECNWGGIYCDDSSSVTRITMSNNNMKGSIPKEIGLLSHLHELDLEQNQLTGSIPDSIDKLTSLLYIDLDKNNLAGTIPEGVYNLLLLQAIDLDTNKLTGTISTRIGQLTDLYIVQFDNNDMTGAIPTEIGELSNLGYLTIVGNSFSAAGVPQEICDSLILVYANCQSCTIDGCCADCL